MNAPLDPDNRPAFAAKLLRFPEKDHRGPRIDHNKRLQERYEYIGAMKHDLSRSIACANAVAMRLRSLDLETSHKKVNDALALLQSAQMDVAGVVE